MYSHTSPEVLLNHPGLAFPAAEEEHSHKPCSARGALGSEGGTAALTSCVPALAVPAQPEAPGMLENGSIPPAGTSSPDSLASPALAQNILQNHQRATEGIAAHFPLWKLTKAGQGFLGAAEEPWARIWDSGKTEGACEFLWKAAIPWKRLHHINLGIHLSASSSANYPEK